MNTKPLRTWLRDFEDMWNNGYPMRGFRWLVHIRDKFLWEEIPAPVTVEPRRLSHIVSIRLTPEELRHLGDAAERRGLTLGKYLKRSAIQQATDDNLAGSVTSTTGFGHVIASSKQTV